MSACPYCQSVVDDDARPMTSCASCGAVLTPESRGPTPFDGPAMMGYGPPPEHILNPLPAPVPVPGPSGFRVAGIVVVIALVVAALAIGLAGWL